MLYQCVHQHRHDHANGEDIDSNYTWCTHRVPLSVVTAQAAPDVSTISWLSVHSAPTGSAPFVVFVEFGLLHRRALRDEITAPPVPHRHKPSSATAGTRPQPYSGSRPGRPPPAAPKQRHPPATRRARSILDPVRDLLVNRPLVVLMQRKKHRHFLCLLYVYIIHFQQSRCSPGAECAGGPARTVSTQRVKQNICIHNKTNGLSVQSNGRRSVYLKSGGN